MVGLQYERKALYRDWDEKKKVRLGSNQTDEVIRLG